MTRGNGVVSGNRMERGNGTVNDKHIAGFTAAGPEDVAGLRSLANQSEAHWGYDRVFMEVFDRTFNITERFILENPVFVSRQGDDPEAFWGLKQDEDGWELEYFYVAEPALGKGLGRRMWDHLTDWCRENRVYEFCFVTSPQAVGFYEKMGAVQDGMVRSAIDGRPIPHFRSVVPRMGD